MAEDSEFPYLSVHERFSFPEPRSATPEGIVGAGGNLSPGMLLSAYQQGIFPWYSEGEPILWWSPDPRFVVSPYTLHVSKSMRKVLRQGRFSITIDRDFAHVVEACANTKRSHEDGTWITSEMQEAYKTLHELGYAHSVEAWAGGELAGGLYGVSLGNAFFGESMFSRRPDASKAAFLLFARMLFSEGFELIDSQVYTEHMARLGGRDIPRSVFLRRLSRALSNPDRVGVWSGFEAELYEAVP